MRLSAESKRMLAVALYMFLGCAVSLYVASRFALDPTAGLSGFRLFVVLWAISGNLLSVAFRLRARDFAWAPVVGALMCWYPSIIFMKWPYETFWALVCLSRRRKICLFEKKPYAIEATTRGCVCSTASTAWRLRRVDGVARLLDGVVSG